MLESFTCLGRKKGGSKPRVHYWPTITLSFSECFDFASLGTGMKAWAADSHSQQPWQIC